MKQSAFIGKTTVLPDGRTGLILACETVRLFGRRVSEYTLAFPADGYSYASYIPAFDIIHEGSVH